MNFIKKRMPDGIYKSSWLRKSLFIMRCILLFLLLGTLQITASVTYSQSTKLSLAVENTTVQDVLMRIEQESLFYFTYNVNQVNVSRKVSVNVKNRSVTDILDELFRGENVKYTINDKHIVLYKADKAEVPDTNQTVRAIKGTVTDTNGEPIVGANIIQKGTTNGVISDIDGNFNINAPEGAVLEISYIGYCSKAVKVGNKTTIRIMIEEDSQKLDEVVVVGYTSQKKGLLAGSVVTTKFSEGLTELPVSSPSEVLAGKMSGVNVSVPTGKPGAQPDVSVRTGTTWNTSPMLYVIDGAVRDKDAFKNLSSSEIESVSVLKDAASAAIYGARSDAGVVLVTTKTGKEGKPSINYTASLSADFATQEVNLTNLYEAGLTVNKMYANIGMTAPTGEAWSDEELAWAKNLPGRGYDMLKDVWNTPYVMNHSLSISGGSEKIKYFGAANYFTQDGFMASTDYKKLNLRLNITADITKDLQVYASIANTNTYTHSAPTEGTDATYTKVRVSYGGTPAHSTSGTKYIGTGWAYGNPAAAADGTSGYNNDNLLNPQINFSLNYKLPWVKGMSVKASYMGSWKNTRNKKYRRVESFYYPVLSGPNNHIVNVDDENLTSFYDSREMAGVWSEATWTTNQQLNFQASYDRLFGKHHVNAALVYEASNEEFYKMSNGRQRFPLYQTDQYWATSSSHDDMSADGGPDTKSGRASYILVGGYDYDNKYIFNFSMRYDGSMKFAPDERWGLFPAASAAWVLSQESFLRDNDKITHLKLRASVGLTGNDAVGGWQWQESYSTGKAYMFGENLSKSYGLKYGSLVNPHLTWEKSLSYNVGVDYEFLGHLHGSVEYWYKHTYDILGNRQNTLPVTFSRSMPAENYGVVNAQGVDLSIGWRDRTGNVDWFANLTASYGWNKVVEKDYSKGLFDWEVPVGKSTTYKSGYSGYIIRNEEQLNEFLANNPNYKTGPTGGLPIQVGSLVYVDKSGPNGTPDGIIDKYDKDVLYSNTNPVNFGLNLGATWKNLSVEVTFTGKLHNPKGFDALAGYYNSELFNTEWLTDSWTPENPDALLPLMVPRNYRTYSWGDVDYWYADASYIRLSNLNIGYTFNFERPLGNAIQGIKLFATGTNLFYISNFKHWHPELSPGTSGVGYPIMRTLGGGVSVNF